MGNATTGSVSGLNPTAADYFAVYAYNAGAARSLPSAGMRLAPFSTDPSVYVNFLDQADIDNESSSTFVPVTEPLVESSFAFTSLGNSNGKGLAITDSGNGYYAYPTKSLSAQYWGTYQSIARTDGHAFDLYSLELLEYQAGSAVITGYDLSGGTVTQVVNLSTSGYASAVAVLDWPDLIKAQVTWWSGLNGSGSQHNGAISDVVFNDLPPTITSASAAPATVIGTSTALSVTAADHNPAANPLSSLLYTWAATTLPSGAAAPIFTNNNSDAAQNTTAFFSAAGSYVFTVTVTDGCNLVATQTVAVTVSQTAGGITVKPAGATVADGGSKQLTAVLGDQFGTAMGTQPGFTWSIASGSGSVSNSGLFTAPSSGSGWTYASASGGGYTGTGAVYYTATVMPNYAGGFSSGALTFAGSGALANGALRLTNSGSSDGAAWYNTKLSTTSFTTAFAFQISTLAGQYMGGMGGDGITFTIQNDAGNAVGSNATGLGYQGITNSVALKFDLVPWDGTWASNLAAGNEELDSIGVFSGGAAPTTPASDLSMTGVQLRDGDVFQASVAYNGTTLAVTLVDMTAIQHWTATESYTVNIPSAVGANTAWFGFTGGSGGNVPASSFQNILWWTYDQPQMNVTPAAVPATVTGTTGQLALQSGSTEGTSGASYTWSAATVPSGAAPPTFGVNNGGSSGSTTATFSAAGTYVLTATMTDVNGNVAANTVTVVVQQTPTTVVVASPLVNLTPGSQQAFSATLDDQFGAAITSSTFTWKATAGNGTVAANGLYTAPASTPETDTLTATSSLGSIKGTATINVVAAVTTLTATPASASQINLAWQAVNGAAGYNVYRGTSPGGESGTPINGGTPVAGTTYDDATASAGTTYYYIIKVANGTNNGPASNEADALTEAYDWTGGAGTWTAGVGGTFAWDDGGNWQGGVAPGSTGETAVLGAAAGGTATITLDAARTLSNLAFSPGTGGSYVISGSVGGLLQLAAGGSPPSISASSGSNAIDVPVVLGGNVNVAAASGATVLISGPISQGGGNYGLTLSGGGNLTLTGPNTYLGGTIVAAGTLRIKSASALAAGGSLTVDAGGIFIFDPSITASTAAATLPDDTPVATPGSVSAFDLAGDSPAQSSASAAVALRPPVSPRNPQSRGLRNSVPAGPRGMPAAERLAGDLAWLGPPAGSADSSDQRHKADVAIPALDAVFAQYGQ